MTKQVPKSQNPKYQAQAILSRREHSEREVRVKLKRKGFTEESINEAIILLKEQKLLNDARFAKMYVESILRGKFVGPRYLRAKLKQRGVGDEHIRAALEDAFTDGKEQDLIKEATEQWKRLHPKYAQDRSRLYRFLLSHGFTLSTISAMFQE